MIKIKQGNDYEIPMTVTKDGAAVDLSSVSEIVWAFARDPDFAAGDADYIVKESLAEIEITDAAAGEIKVYVYGTRTASLDVAFYYYALQITFDNGNILELPDEDFGYVQLQGETLTN